MGGGTKSCSAMGLTSTTVIELSGTVGIWDSKVKVSREHASAVSLLDVINLQHKVGHC